MNKKYVENLKSLLRDLFAPHMEQNGICLECLTPYPCKFVDAADLVFELIDEADWDY